MRLLDRYLIRELLTPLAICLSGFLIFFISFTLFQELGELQERKLHLWDVMEYCAAITPGMLVTVLPVGLLLALLYTLTNHARHHEITAMRAAGLSLGRICVPYFGVGLLATGVYFALNEVLVPASADWAFRIKTRYVVKPEDARQQTQAVNFGLMNERANRLWIIARYDGRTTMMSGVKVTWPLADGSTCQLDAEHAVRTNGVWIFFGTNGVMERVQAAPNVPWVPIWQTNVLAMPEFDETPRQIQGEIKMGNFQTLDPRTETIPLQEIWEYLRTHHHLRKEQVSKWKTTFQERLAAPWTCLVVVLIAIPFGAPSGRRNLFFGVAGSIFIVAGYMVAQQVSLALGSHGEMPAWLAAWLPNMLFAATGLVLTMRVR